MVCEPVPVSPLVEAKVNAPLGVPGLYLVAQEVHHLVAKFDGMLAAHVGKVGARHAALVNRGAAVAVARKIRNDAGRESVGRSVRIPKSPPRMLALYAGEAVTADWRV